MASKKETPEEIRRRKKREKMEDIRIVLEATWWLWLPFLIFFLFLLYCFIPECSRRPTYHPAPATYHSQPSKHETSAPATNRPHQKVTPVDSKENRLIDKLGREDYYEESDYHDGLSGEYNDLDYNEVRDYYAD